MAGSRDRNNRAGNRDRNCRASVRYRFNAESRNGVFGRYRFNAESRNGVFGRYGGDRAENFRGPVFKSGDRDILAEDNNNMFRCSDSRTGGRVRKVFNIQAQDIMAIQAQDIMAVDGDSMFRCSDSRTGDRVINYR